MLVKKGKQQTSTFISYSIIIHVPTMNMPSNAIYMPFIPMSSCAHETNCVSIYISYEFNVINYVTTSTDIHTFHITGICNWTNMPATSYTCSTALLLYSICRRRHHFIYKYSINKLQLSFTTYVDFSFCCSISWLVYSLNRAALL